jgi:hypothetical protein
MQLTKRKPIKNQYESDFSGSPSEQTEPINMPTPREIRPRTTLVNKFLNATSDEIREVIILNGIHPAGENILQALTTMFTKCDMVLEALLNERKTILQADFYQTLAENALNSNVPFILSLLCPSTYIMGTLSSADYQDTPEELSRKMTITPASGWKGPPHNRTIDIPARTRHFANTMKERLCQLTTANMNWATAMSAYRNFLSAILRPIVTSRNQLLNKLAWIGQHTNHDVSCS